MADTSDRNNDGAADDGAKLYAFPEAGPACASVGRLDQARAYGSDLVARFRVWFRREAASFGLTEQQAAERVGIAAGIVVVLAVVVTLLAQLVGFVGDTVAPHLAQWWRAGLRAAGVGSPAHNPVKAYLGQHAAGLPWDGQTLLYGWVVVGVAVWVLAALRIRAAQLGWLGYAVATAAMAYAGATGPSAPIVAGIVVVAAVVLSIPVARRGPADAPDVYVVPVEADRSGRDAPVRERVA
jgi:hypothetical protein